MTHSDHLQTQVEVARVEEHLLVEVAWQCQCQELLVLVLAGWLGLLVLLAQLLAVVLCLALMVLLRQW